jgi:hypothetical protein
MKRVVQVLLICGLATVGTLIHTVLLLNPLWFRRALLNRFYCSNWSMLTVLPPL